MPVHQNSASRAVCALGGRTVTARVLQFEPEKAASANLCCCIPSDLPVGQAGVLWRSLLDPALYANF